MTSPAGVFLGTMSNTASARAVSTPPTRVGTTTQSAADMAFSSIRSLPGGESTMPISSGSMRSRARVRSRPVGASTTDTSSSGSPSACSIHSAALACASASIRVTGRRLAAATAARYTEVVVFPTPPFNAATTTIMRGN